jgi:arylsulfatase A-like enzyme
VLATAGAEGLRAGFGCALAAVDAKSAAMAVFEGFGVVGLPLLVVALPLGALLGRPEVRASTDAWRFAVVGDAARAPLVVVGLPLTVLGVAVGVAATAGSYAATQASARVAVSIAIAATIATLLVATLAASWIVHRLAAPFRALVAHPGALRFLESEILGSAVCAIVVWLTLSALFPLWVLTTLVPGIGVVAACVCAPLREPLARAFAGKRLAIASLAILGSGLLAIHSFDRAPSSVRLAVIYETPLAGPLIVGVRSLVDRDGDGYSPVLGGGDCDDHDAAIQPKAHDTPGNGIDENCSGADATPYVALPQPAFSRPSGLPVRPNIVLIHMDALRPDHLGFAGYERATSPNLDAFRATATWFSRAYTPAPSTRFAMASLFTGLDVERIPQSRGSANDIQLLPGALTLAERLAPLGYERVGYTISYVPSHIKGIGAGFGVWETPWPDAEWKKREPRAATLTTDAGLRFLEGHVDTAGHPFLLFLHYRCTHEPYSPDPRWKFGYFSADDYDSGVAYCDDELGRVFRSLSGRADAERTVVIVYSDHGEMLGEHGYHYHGQSLLEPEVRVLLLVRVPGLHPVSTVHVPVTLLDLAPTIESIAGAAPDVAQSGWNLLPLLVLGDVAGDAARPIFLYTDHLAGTVRHEADGVVVGDRKWVRDYVANAATLVDLGRDPGEHRDLGSRLPDERARLAALLDGWEADVTAKH